jgi:hypothetical protein
MGKWASKKQERWGNSRAGHAALTQEEIDTRNAASRGKKLPLRAAKAKTPVRRKRRAKR